MMELLLKVTGLILLGGAVALVLRFHSAAARHFAWALALSSTLLLPILVPIVPAVYVTMIREAPGLPAARPAPLPAPRPAPPPAPHAVETEAIVVAIEMPAPAASSPSFAAMITMLWILGCVGLLARIVVGHIGIARIAKRSTPIGPEWEPLARAAIESTGIQRSVRVAYSPVVGGPLAWGWRRPIILFPNEAKDWPLDRMKVALLHELAHVARFDHLSQLVGQLACALYWFHPLVWFAARAMRDEGEHACDDRVLEAGMPGPDYAELLLEVARAVRAPRFDASVAMSMARGSHLEDRLRAVLDDGRTRRSLPPGARGFLVFLVVLILIPIAGLTAKYVLAPDAPPEPPFPAKPVAVDVDSDGKFVREIEVSPNELLRMHLAAGGDVRLIGWDETRVRVEIDQGGDRDRSRLEVEREEGGVRVALGHGSGSHEIQVHVPRKFNLELESSHGDIDISGVEGTFRGNTGGGRIVITDARGRAELNTGGGEITVSDSKLDGWVNTGGGGVRVLRVEGGLRANSGGGPVVYQQHEGDPLRVENAGGDIKIDEAPGGGKFSTGGGNIRIGRSGSIEAETGGGNIDLGPVAGSVKATTGGGNVQVTIEATREEQTIELSSGSGNVTLFLPESFEGSFDLETAGHAKIETAWSLPIETSDGATRARGNIGSSSNVVRVRTVDGNIAVRAR